MFKEMLREVMKPIVKEVYAEGYNKGSEDTARRMHEMLKYGEAKGYADAVADCGVIELDDIDGIGECLSVLVDEKAKEVFK